MPADVATDTRVLALVHHPDPRLYTRCAPVTVFGLSLDAVMDEMLDLMKQAHPGHPRGGVGLAGPQVGLMQRVIVMHSAPERPAFKMVNPWIAVRPGVQTATASEGCLSLIDLSVNVARYERVDVFYQHAVTGENRRDAFEGFEARIVQHEIDHLDGITLVSRARRGARFDFERRWGKAPDVRGVV